MGTSWLACTMAQIRVLEGRLSDAVTRTMILDANGASSNTEKAVV